MVFSPEVFSFIATSKSLVIIASFLYLTSTFWLLNQSITALFTFFAASCMVCFNLIASAEKAFYILFFKLNLLTFLPIAFYLIATVFFTLVIQFYLVCSSFAISWKLSSSLFLL